MKRLAGGVQVASALLLCGAFGAVMLPATAWAQDASGAASASDAPAEGMPDTASPAGPNEEAIAEAARRYDLGLRLYAEGEFRLAVIEFERSYQITGDYRVLYNIGQVRIQLGNYAKAIKALSDYLKDGGDKISEDRRKAVEADLEMLASRTGNVRIVTKVSGADILVDDLPVGQAPLPDTLLLDAGEHRVTARKAGYEPRTVPFTLAGRDSMLVEIDLVKLPERGPSRIVVEKHVPLERDSTWMWATWSATGVLAIGAGVTGGLGIKAANDLDDLRRDREATRGELDSASRRSRTLLLTADVLGGLAIATGGLALYLTLSDPGSGDDKSAKSNEPSRGRTGVFLGPNQVQVLGSF